MYFQQVITCTCTLSRSFYVKMYFQEVSTCRCTTCMSFYVKIFFSGNPVLTCTISKSFDVKMYFQQVREDVQMRCQQGTGRECHVLPYN